MVLITSYFNKSLSSDSDIIFAEYYSPPMGFIIRGETINSNTSLYKCEIAHQLLDNKKFNEAKVAFQELMTNSDCMEKALFYHSLILIKEGNMKDAKSQLKLILDSPQSGYEEKTSKLLLEIN